MLLIESDAGKVPVFGSRHGWREIHWNRRECKPETEQEGGRVERVVSSATAQTATAYALEVICSSRIASCLWTVVEIGLLVEWVGERRVKSEERRGTPQASRVLVSLRERRNIVDLSNEQVKSRMSRDQTNAAHLQVSRSFPSPSVTGRARYPEKDPTAPLQSLMHQWRDPQLTRTRRTSSRSSSVRGEVVARGEWGAGSGCRVLRWIRECAWSADGAWHLVRWLGRERFGWGTLEMTMSAGDSEVGRRIVRR